MTGIDNEEHASADVPGRDESPATNRRKVIRKLLVSSSVVAGSRAIPEKWSEPIVDSVLLPAHAQATSEGPGSPVDPPIAVIDPPIAQAD